MSDSYVAQLHALADQLRAAADTASRRGLRGLAQTLTEARDSALSWADAPGDDLDEQLGDGRR